MPFKLLALYSYMPSEPFSWFRTSYESLRLPWKGLRSVFANWYKVERQNIEWEFIHLRLGADYSKVPQTYGYIFLFSLTKVSLIGFYGTTRFNLCSLAQVSKWNLLEVENSGMFWNGRMGHNIRFHFSDLQQLFASYLATDISFSWGALYSNRF